MVRKCRSKRGREDVLPEHLQGVGLMDLNATFGAVIAVLKMLHDAALTDCRRNNMNTFHFIKTSISS